MLNYILDKINCQNFKNNVIECRNDVEKQRWYITFQFENGYGLSLVKELYPMGEDDMWSVTLLENDEKGRLQEAGWRISQVLNTAQVLMDENVLEELKYVNSLRPNCL